MCAGFALAWLVYERGWGRWRLAAAAVLGLGLTLVGIVIAGHLHTDPRPFVQDPSLTPLFSHAPDNGFPSNHSAAAGLIAALVLLRRRWLIGLGLAGCAVAVGAARVAAHVHHVQDIVAGLLIGAAAAAIALVLVALLSSRLAARRGSEQPTPERVEPTA